MKKKDFITELKNSSLVFIDGFYFNVDKLIEKIQIAEIQIKINISPCFLEIPLIKEFLGFGEYLSKLIIKNHKLKNSELKDEKKEIMYYADKNNKINPQVLIDDIDKFNKIIDKGNVVFKKKNENENENKLIEIDQILLRDIINIIKNANAIILQDKANNLEFNKQ
ncbi:MAG: hypothetical protein KAT68_00570 [Bacteroidales bacterium]|nr:hypothetical protein [Bacteroidales bacterium]